MQTEPRDATIYEQADYHVLASWDRLLFTVFRGQTTLGAVKTTRRIHEQLAQRYPDGVCTLMLVEPHTSMPSTQVRQALADALEASSSSTVLSAVVHEGSGFQASAVRSVVTGLSMLTRPSFPHKIFATLADAARWLAGNSGFQWEPLEIVRVVENVRSPRNWHSEKAPRRFA